MKSGILVVNKPQGISSAGVVNRLKHLLKVKKIGHIDFLVLAGRFVNLPDAPTDLLIVGNLAKTYRMLKNYKKAIDYFNNAIKMSSKIGAKIYMTTFMVDYSNFLIELNRNEEAMVIILEAELLANELLGGTTMKGTKLIKVGVAAVCLAAVFQGTASAGWSLNVGIGYWITDVQTVVLPRQHVDYVCYEPQCRHPRDERYVLVNPHVVRHDGRYVRQPEYAAAVKVKGHEHPIFQIIRPSKEKHVKVVDKRYVTKTTGGKAVLFRW